MIDAIIVAIISAIGSLVGVYFSNRKAQALLEYRLQQLEKKVDLHNNVIQRTYELEKQVAILQEDVKN